MVRRNYAAEWKRAITEAAGETLLRGSLKELVPGVLATTGTTKGVSFGDIAREAVPSLGGIIIATDNGLTWVCGKAGTVGRLIIKDMVPGIVEANHAYRAIMGEGTPVRWSVSSMARSLLSQITPRPTNKIDETLLPGDVWHHQSCFPCTFGEATQYDVSSYYYQLLCRMESPDVCKTSNPRKPLIFQPLPRGDRETWGNIVNGIKPSKILRNTIVGCMIGSKGQTWAYSREGLGVKRWPMKKQLGPLRAAGMLIVGSGNEIIHRESLLSGSIYSNIDCITLHGKECSLPILDSLGLPYGIKASGSGEVCHAGSWSIGGVETRPYIKGDREHVHREAGPKPPVDLIKHWL